MTEAVDMRDLALDRDAVMWRNSGDLRTGLVSVRALPMGDSGLGRRHGAEGIRRYTEAQTVTVQRLLPLGPPAGMAVQRFVALTNAQLRLLRRLRVR